MTISIQFDPSVNYAFQQNAIPVVKELRVGNGGRQRENLTVNISVEPAFAEPLVLRVQSLGAGQEFVAAQKDLNLQLSPLFLAGLNERVGGLLRVEVFENGALMVSRTESIELFAHNEWCGLRSLPEILAAFVLPNDAAVTGILGRAAEILGAQTGRPALNAYQDKNKKIVWQQIAAIYQAVAEQRVRYIVAPASFERAGQKVRFPADIQAEKFGNCLDLSLLFAACCEQCGLHPLILMHEGHAYAGCWLEDKTLPDAAGDDLQIIRKLVELQELVVWESTAVTAGGPANLSLAADAAREHLHTAKNFLMALDVRRARISRIRPLPVPGQVSANAGAENNLSVSGGAQNLPDTPEFDEPPPLTVSAPPADAQPSRVDLWKNKLLDLSLRNRLLNFRETKGTIAILSPNPEHVEDELAGNTELKLLPRPLTMSERDPRNAAAYTQQQNGDALVEHLRDELKNRRLHTGQDEAEHQRRLTELYRASRLALEENGTNTLFVAVGMLEWRETDAADRVLRAPLLLVPVELRRKSVLEGFALRRIDEETRLNVTLLEMLRQNFGKEIAGLGPLPEDDSGADVPLVLRIFKEAVRDLKGWEVKPEIWLAQFSFAKFLLWKDLSDRLPELKRNRVVRHMIEEAGAPYPNPPGDIRPEILDEKFHPQEIFCPLSADSSQLAAVMTAADGHDFVLEGPPGTGKSQTITNIIAHCLAIGKRVLFVAEKRAALDVVHRRLKQQNLEPFCLELHSNKSGKREVLEQFRGSLESAQRQRPEAWAARADELRRLRDTLNNYVRALHLPRACGLSAYQCLDYLLARKNEPALTLSGWPDLLNTPPDSLSAARELASLLQSRAAALNASVSGHALAEVGATAWSPAWETQARAQIEALSLSVSEAAGAADDFCRWLNVSKNVHSQTELYNYYWLAETLCQPLTVGAEFATAPWPALDADLARWTSLAVERGELRARLADFDEQRLATLDLSALQARWHSARDKWFLPKWLECRAVKKLLLSVSVSGRAPATASVAALLADAARLQIINRELAADRQRAEACLGALWLGGEPDAASLSAARAWGANLHARLLVCAGEDFAWLEQLRARLALLLREGAAAYGEGTAVGERLRRYMNSLSAMAAGFNELAENLQLRRESADADADHLGALKKLLERLLAGRPHLRRWCAWQDARRQAIVSGLGALVNAVETDADGHGDLPALFERSFRRDLLDAVIGSDEVLQKFFGREHAEKIKKFCQVDEQLATLARDLIAARLSAAVPQDQPAVADIPKQEIGLLRRELNKRMRHIPVRKLLGEIPNLLPRLKPCVLMSPLSVAQYLDASQTNFDVVIFDEASQIPVWDAVGAIARGTQLIVVGDPKQLPPTNFFNVADSDDGADADGDNYQDLESILDELMTQGLRHKRLLWHYRSRHEGLITFSNRAYYDNSLLTFPSAVTDSGGVRLNYLPEARYDKGKSRTNPAEARALVDELVRRLRAADGEPRSFGVVTFSGAQQKLVEDLLDQQRREHPEIEPHFGDDAPVAGEPVFVKNLENVQGDERDVIFFSVCYGPDAAGKISLNFGPLNREGGERRLNVAITRAKHEVLVFSSLRGDRIDLTRTRARGVQDLKQFLDYAERGPRAPVTAADADAAPDSEFEKMVAEKIRAAGYAVHHQVGCSGYRIDLGVADPQAPGKYLLGIECDGATYHRAATARDRDKLRQQILEGLGWRIHRIWSTDWWHDADAELEKLLARLEACR